MRARVRARALDETVDGVAAVAVESVGASAAEVIEGAGEEVCGGSGAVAGEESVECAACPGDAEAVAVEEE